MTATHQRIAALSGQQRNVLAQSLRELLERDSADHDHYDVAIIGGGVAGLTLAIQLHKARPDTRITVIERQAHPVRETTHKVGESTVEIAAHYLRDIIGLEDHLSTQQIRKFGLRMFFSNDGNTDIAERVELGSSQFPPLCTYQLDRGRLENELGERCRAAGIEFNPGCKVLRVDLADHAGAHHIRLLDDGGERTIQARWVVDATGRGTVLQRKLQLRKPVEHVANAAWFRIAHPIDIGTWTADSAWQGRIVEGDRALSTNHLMGSGYWVWLIALASGSISIGIVAEDAAHSFSEFNTFDRALEWLRNHEPQCAAAIAEHVDKVQDFRVMKNYSYGCDQVYAGDARWCLTGESGVFLDPLYSPGLDLIAISNSLVVDIVGRALDGEDVTTRASIHDSLFRQLAAMWLAIYEKQYRLMGNAQVMTSKVIWDTAFYWGVFGLLFFQDKFHSVANHPPVAADLGRLTEISNRVQAFFREWETIDDSKLDARFVDLYSPLNFMVQLHTGMTDQLTDADFERRFAANRQLFEQLAGQLISTVIDAYAGRYHEDAVMAQIQRWQRDPLVGQLLATFRRERHRSPTSEGWMTLPNAGSRQPDPAGEQNGDNTHERRSAATYA
ncbi:NAD(P)/FAD-dependent oxidoreductase [Nocardia sp. NPDC051321]|uniref:NAD(P)/FAD-dependent oxidoreductase n=1 Tax=Nocardia sp. NPDC051321 TaxID=3364323 RepID=UPI0037B843E1